VLAPSGGLLILVVLLRGHVLHAPLLHHSALHHPAHGAGHAIRTSHHSGPVVVTVVLPPLGLRGKRKEKGEGKKD